MNKKQSITFDCSPPPRPKIPLTPENLKYAMRKIASSYKHPDTLANEDPNCASWQDWLDWFDEDESTKKKYLEAITLQSLYAAGNMLEVAHNTTNDNWCYTQAVLGQTRWSAQKLIKEIFGDKVQIEHKQIRAEEWIELMKEPDSLMIEKIK